MLAAALVAACTVTPPRPLTGHFPESVDRAALDRYRLAVAERIVERSPSRVFAGNPQAMLRSLVVVAFTVDGRGQIVASSVYRTNGDDEANHTALSTLRRAGPLPPPPPQLLNARGQIELMEDWLFDDDGKFQLRTLASPQAQSFD
ncbi:TonB family protein [Burkholderia sp. WAC0059]|uniref:TonB family protein n=1 Tax=Burkholderia sp. WAC0059 TaxID=2066022 RepID=UPI00215540A3|nr:TonB family protein [Burkholderia sp. WAC0059]